MTAPLFWNANGRVACERHAPIRNGSLWQLEGWTEAPLTLECESCDKEHG